MAEINDRGLSVDEICKYLGGYKDTVYSGSISTGCPCIEWDACGSSKKNRKSYFGYKNPITVDAKSKLIKDDSVSSAEVDGSQEFEDLLDGKGDKEQQVYADSSYR